MLLDINALESYSPDYKIQRFELPPSKGSDEPTIIYLTEWNGDMRDVWEVFLMEYLEKNADGNQRGYRSFAVVLSLCNEQGEPTCSSLSQKEIEDLAYKFNSKVPHSLLYKMFDWLDETNLITMKSRKEALGNSKGTPEADSGTNSQNATDVPSES